MKVLKLLMVVIILAYSYAIQAQSPAKNDIALITATLTDYIEGSTNGQPNRLKKAFHEDLNLYYVKEGKLKTWSGTAYIEDTKAGEPTGEKAKILAIDFENDIAVAKVQVADPTSSNAYVDYFMLLKLETGWKIIHKMFTKRTL